MRNRVVAAVALGVGRVTQEDARKRARSELMRGGRGDAGIAEAPEDAKIVIGWGRPEQKMMRCIAPSWFARSDVEKKGGGGECIRPKASGHVCMEEQCAHTLIEGAENTFGTAVLLGCVWTS